MKKVTKILLMAITAGFLSSCGAVDYTKPANAMCECMQEKEAERDPDAIFGEDFEYANCAFDVMLATRTDINNEQFGEALKASCEQYANMHADYLKILED